MAAIDTQPAIQAGPFEPQGKVLTQAEKRALAVSGLKFCRPCGNAKPFKEFRKNRSRVDGLNNRCSACQSAEKAEYYRENRHKLLVRRAAHYQRNRDRVRSQVADYRRRNPGKVRERRRDSIKRESAALYRAKAVLERAIVHFEGRADWLERIAHEIDESPAARKLQFASDALDGFVALHVYGES
jgi:hypothetical protein